MNGTAHLLTPAGHRRMWFKRKRWSPAEPILCKTDTWKMNILKTELNLSMQDILIIFAEGGIKITKSEVLCSHACTVQQMLQLRLHSAGSLVC